MTNTTNNDRDSGFGGEEFLGQLNTVPQQPSLFLPAISRDV